MRETVISRQNQWVKRICALSDKKARRAEACFRFDGIKLLCEAVETGLSLVCVALRMPMNRAAEETVTRLVGEGSLEESLLLPVSEAVFDKMTEEKSPEGVITVAKMPGALHRSVSGRACSDEVSREERLLILESLRDPGNLGTVLRSAFVLGLDRLILTDDCADLYHPKAVRGAMGALFRLPTLTVPREELPMALRALREGGRRIYATALHTDAGIVGTFDLRPGDGFVIGNEGHGLSHEVIDASDGAAVIPMREGAESLNAAAAAAICIWETVRAK